MISGSRVSTKLVRTACTGVMLSSNEAAHYQDCHQPVWCGIKTEGVPWLIHVNVWQKPVQYCKVISLQLKKKKKKAEGVEGGGSCEITFNQGRCLCSSSMMLCLWGFTFKTLFFSSVQSLSRVWLFGTPWTAARQASLSITNSRSPHKPMSIESVMPSNHLILCLWGFTFKTLF